MTDAELHIALREVVAIGRRGGYDNDEIADKLIGVVRDYANDFAAMKLTEAAEGHYRSIIAGADVVMADDVLRRAKALTEHRAAFEPCEAAPIGIVTNCAAMGCEGKGCAMSKTQEPVSLDDLVMTESQREQLDWELARERKEASRRRIDERICQCPESNPDCEHPTCPRWPQPGHIAAARRHPMPGYDQGWILGYFQGRDDEANGLPLREAP